MLLRAIQQLLRKEGLSTRYDRLHPRGHTLCVLRRGEISLTIFLDGDKLLLSRRNRSRTRPLYSCELADPQVFAKMAERVDRHMHAMDLMASLPFED